MNADMSQHQTNPNLMARVFQFFSFFILMMMVVVQFNDPDPYFWIAFYGCCALIPLLSFFNINNKLLFYSCLVFCAVTIFISSKGALEYTHHYKDESILQSMSADKLYLEETREFFGSLIALLLISLHQFIVSRQNRK